MTWGRQKERQPTRFSGALACLPGWTDERRFLCAVWVHGEDVSGVVVVVVLVAPSFAEFKTKANSM